MRVLFRGGYVVGQPRFPPLWLFAVRQDVKDSSSQESRFRPPEQLD